MSSKWKAVKDGFLSLYSNLGAETNKRNTTMWQGESNYLTETYLTDIYQTAWIVRKAIDLPVNDALSCELEFTDNEDLKLKSEELDIMGKMKEALILARIYGGSAIIPVIEELVTTEPETELNYDNIKKIISFNVVDAYELNPKTYDDNVMSPTFGLPLTWEYFPYSPGVTAQVGKIIHTSRIISLYGDFVPKRSVRIELMYPWGQSVIQTIYNAFRDYSIVEANTIEISQTYLTKILKMLNYFDLIQSAEGRTVIEARVANVNEKMSAFRTLVTDKEEDMIFRTTNLAGYEKIIDFVTDQLCGSANIPRQRFFSQQLGTLAGAGESTKQYYDFLNQIQTTLYPAVDRLLAMMKSELDITDKIEWRFTDITQPDNKKEAETKKITADTDNIYINAGVLTPEEIRINRFEGGYSPDTKLDAETD